MMMKRSRNEESEAVNDGLATLANYLMLFSNTTSSAAHRMGNGSHHDRVFECKTCNRQFSSFQALGGHRASHKRPRLSGPAHDAARSSSENSSISNGNSYSSAPATGNNKRSKKTHECTICGVQFALGQALGGHMRRHRAALFADELPTTALSLSLGSCRLVKEVEKAAEKVVMVNDVDGGSTLCLDLSL